MNRSWNTERCRMCKRPLNQFGDPTTRDCDGDCLRCMAEIGDPDCIAAMTKIIGETYE
jgi:hypothetical protein